MEPKNVLVLLKEHRSFATATERNVIDYVLGNPNEAAGLTIHELAAKTFASASTISRLCAGLGEGGYKDFQRDLVFSLAVEQESGHVELEDLSPKDSVAQTIAKVIQRHRGALAITEKLNDATTVGACIELMSAARVINLVGMGSSLIPASDLHYKLIRSNVVSNYSEDWHLQLVCARNATPDTLTMAFSYSGTTREVLSCVRAARERGSRIVSVTRSGGEGELARLSDQVLRVASNEPILRSSASTSRISQLAVVDILFSAYATRNYDRLSRAVEQNYIER